MLNIFAFRATLPKDMMTERDPVGCFNDDALKKYTKEAGVAIACWGGHGVYMDRGDEVIMLLGRSNLFCLGMTQKGQPKHPLYLNKKIKPISMALNREQL
jgi:hypothetical protein